MSFSSYIDNPNCDNSASIVYARAFTAGQNIRAWVKASNASTCDLIPAGSRIFVRKL